MADSTAGLVYHAVLSLFLGELIKSGEPISLPAGSGPGKKPLPKLPEHYRRLLSQKIESVFEAFPCLPGSAGAEMSMLAARLLRAEKKLFCARLEKFLAEFASLFAGHRVVASEERCFLESGFYALSGIVDCILEDAREGSPSAGSLAIVDFKMSKAPKFSESFAGEGSLSDFQIPAYLRLAEAALKKEAHAALFFSIGDAKAQLWFGATQNALTGARNPKKEEDAVMRGGGAFAAVMGEFDEKSERFAREILGGLFPAAPSYSGRCGGCNYSKVCRMLYKVK